MEAAYARISTTNDMTVLQVVSSVFRAFTSWLVLVIVVNDDIFLTRQQWVSLLFRVFITVLWEVQHRLVLAP